MNTVPHVPPGFRFYPTDEELVDYYLRKKIASRKIDLNVIRDVDLYKIEPWDLQEYCRIGAEEQLEWHFFSHKDKKYPTGTRTNRATKTGFWKATGRDKPIYSKHNLIGMRKTLVYYMGRAPNGQKSDWIMHEYRLESNENGTPQEEGWVVCKVFKKRVTAIRRGSEVESSHWFDEQVSFMPDNLDTFHHLPHLQSPKVLPNFNSQMSSHQFPHLQSQFQTGGENIVDQSAVAQVTDWRIFDKFVASQLSPGDVSKEPDFTDLAESIQISSKREAAAEEYELISNSSCPVDLWM